jgi:hypothetical protein
MTTDEVAIDQVSIDQVSNDAARSRVAGFRDPTWLTRSLVTLLWIIVAADAAAAISRGFEIALLDSLQQHTYTSIAAARVDALASDARQKFIGAVQIVLAIISGIVFFCWVYRANANARQLGAVGMASSPGWAVGCFFIPIANLWMPYQAIKEIWQASAAPADWQNRRRGAILPWWWLFFLLSSIAGQVAFVILRSAHDISTMIVGSTAALLANAIAVVARLTTLALVRQIHRMQIWHASSQSVLAALD